MGRMQYKNTFDNIKSNITPPETTGFTIAILELPNAEEAEANYLSNNFMKMIEALKEEINNSFKQMEEKTNKK